MKIAYCQKKSFSFEKIKALVQQEKKKKKKKHATKVNDQQL